MNVLQSITVFFTATCGRVCHLVQLATDKIGARALLAWVLLLGCTVLALSRPLFGYDTWAYHLPFSSRLWDIGGGVGSFHLSPGLTERWLGFPKAWEWVQGFAWAITGTLYAIIVPQILLCAAYFTYVSRAHRIPIAWVILAFFASPMLFIHFQAVYIDLPAAICTALGFFLLLDLLEDAQVPDRSFVWARAIAAVAALGLAGNIKYQSFLGCLCISAIVGVLCLATRDIPVQRRAILIAVLLIANVLASASAISNLARYGNPFYPLQIKALGATVFDGPESPEMGASYPTYLLTGSREVNLPGPLNFILSATELDWNMRDVAPWYNIDSVTGRSPRRGAPSRTGGWGNLFILVNACLLMVQAFHLHRETDRQQRLFVISTLLLIAATACLPRAHELRYWLYVPLVLIPVNLRYLWVHNQSAIVPGTLIVLMAYGVVQTVLSPKSELFTPRPLSITALRAEVPPAIVQALHETGRYCAPGDDFLFRYSTAVTGLPGLLSRVAADCP